MYTVYGIKNCNTVKKALDWLDQHKVPYKFHDYKKQGISRRQLGEWTKQTDWEKLLNKKGTTWKKLDKDLQDSIDDADKAMALMEEKTSIIRRPLIEDKHKIITIGFDESEYKRLFNG